MADAALSTPALPALARARMGFGRLMRAAVGVVAGALLVGNLAGCASAPPLSVAAVQAPIGTIRVSSRDLSIVLHRLEPMVAAELRSQLGPRYAPGARGAATLTVVLDEVDVPSSGQLSARGGLFGPGGGSGDSLWGAVTLTRDGRVLAQNNQVLGNAIHLISEQLYGRPDDDRLAELARNFARSAVGAVGS